MSSSVEVSVAPAAGRTRDGTLLQTARAQLELVVTQLEHMAVAHPWSAVGYFEAADHNRMEHFFFRFLVSRQVLVSLAQHAHPPPPSRPYQKLVEGAVGLSASVKTKMSETKTAQLLLVEAENVKTKISETKAAQLFSEAPLLLEGATENVKTKISDTTAKLRAYTTITASTTTTTTSTLEDANHVENDEENDDDDNDNDNDKHDSESDHEDEDNDNDDEKEDDDNDEDKDSSSVRIALTAGYAALYYECRLVHAFQDDPVAVDQLNQKFNRSEIARDTFRQLQLDCMDTTRHGRLESLDHAYHCYCETDQARSTYFMEDDVDVDDELLPDLYAKTKTLTTALVGTTFQYMALENKLQQTTLAKNTYRAKRTTGDLLKKIRAQTYKGVSRLKSPTAYLIQFSATQKRDIFARLQPGDLVFTYTAGYMSSIFIPGHFKHGITYIGSPDARRTIGLTADTLATCCHTNDEGAVLPTTTAEQRKLLAQFEVSSASLDANLSADVIEAVAEGVIFNNLEHLMDTHVNRFLVLRPKITAAERIHALMDIFRYLGASYDFSFSFANTSAVVCTEIIYHAFTGKGAIDFALVDHAGHLSLSADDIVQYYLQHRSSFDFVCLAVEDPDATDQHEARVYTGEEGLQTLETLMAGSD